MQNDSYNRGGFIAFLFSMAFSLAFFIYVTLVHPGIDLKELPEQAADQTLAGGQAAFNPNTVEKPWVSSEEMIAHGTKAYANNCAVCHGDKYDGVGPGAAGLTPPPRNLIEGKWTKGGDSVGLFKVITDGIPGTSMASFAHLSLGERWALVHMIKSVTNNKVKDDEAKLEAFAKTAK